MLEKLFQLLDHGTDVKTEIITRLTTFAAMAYILAINPAILSDSGMGKEGLITVTALAAIVGTMTMALLTNYPIALYYAVLQAGAGNPEVARGIASQLQEEDFLPEEWALLLLGSYPMK